MRVAKILIFVAIALCVNARCIKRKKIAKALKPRGCQICVDRPNFKPQAYASLCGCPDVGCSGSCGYPGTCGTSGCPGTCGTGCPGYDYRACGCQSIFVEELPGCNYGCSCDGYGILSSEILSCDRIPVLRLPQSCDACIPAINLPACQCDIPNCQCQKLPYQILDSPCKRPSVPRIIQMPMETVIQTVVIEQPALRLPCGCQSIDACGCQSIDVCGCQRQTCGYQLTELDMPCTCQLPALGSCGCPLSAIGMPCGCQMSVPCEYQLPTLDCGCQSPCGCQPIGGSCGCQLPVPNVPYAYYIPSSEIPYIYQLDQPAYQVPGCGCQLPNCGCQLPSCGCQLPECRCQSAVCGQYLRQVTLQPPCL